MRGPDKGRRASRRGREPEEGEIDALLAQHPLPAPHEEPPKEPKWTFGSFTPSHRFRLRRSLIKTNPALVQAQLDHLTSLLNASDIAAAQLRAAEYLAPRVGCHSGEALLLRLWRWRHGNS